MGVKIPDFQVFAEIHSRPQVLAIRIRNIFWGTKYDTVHAIPRTFSHHMHVYRTGTWAVHRLSEVWAPLQADIRLLHRVSVRFWH